MGYKNHAVTKLIEFNNLNDYVRFYNGKLKLGVNDAVIGLKTLSIPTWHRSATTDNLLDPFNQMLLTHTHSDIEKFHSRNDLPFYPTFPTDTPSAELDYQKQVIIGKIMQFQNQEGIDPDVPSSSKAIYSAIGFPRSRANLPRLLRFFPTDIYNVKLRLITSISNPYIETEEIVRIAMVIRAKTASNDVPYFVYDPAINSERNAFIDSDKNWFALQRENAEGRAIFYRNFNSLDSLSRFLNSDKTSQSQLNNPSLKNDPLLSSIVKPTPLGTAYSQFSLDDINISQLLKPIPQAGEYLTAKVSITSPVWLRRKALTHKIPPWDRHYAKKTLAGNLMLEILRAIFQPPIIQLKRQQTL